MGSRRVGHDLTTEHAQEIIKIRKVYIYSNGIVSKVHSVKSKAQDSEDAV